MQFLKSEFDRLNCQLPVFPTLCTMHLAGGGKLTECCNDYGVVLDGDAHSALVDARATARLLKILLDGDLDAASNLPLYSPIPWPMFPSTSKTPISRIESRSRQSVPPTYLNKLLSRQCSNIISSNDAGKMAYSALLCSVLEDRWVTDAEGEALYEMAEHMGLSGQSIAEVHREFLSNLVSAAVADDVITQSERRDLELVARLLGLNSTPASRQCSCRLSGGVD